jgi:hypothetical protein
MSLEKTAASLLILLLCAPAHAQDSTCTPPLKSMLRVELYFGRSIKGSRPVSDREWAQFVSRELTPRFPGLTMLDGRGAWRRGEHEMREQTKIVIVVLPDSPANRGQIAAATDAYKEAFQQTSVGIVSQPVCAAF